MIKALKDRLAKLESQAPKDDQWWCALPWEDGGNDCVSWNAMYGGAAKVPGKKECDYCTRKSLNVFGAVR